MKFSSIKKLPTTNYHTHVPFGRLERWLERQGKDYEVNTDPAYQRGYVWTDKQKTEFVEYVLKGGQSGRDIYWNCPAYDTASNDLNFELVDGKQRLSAILGFLRNEVKTFGYFYNEFEDADTMLKGSDLYFKMNINNLQTQTEVVDWYLGMNTGGSVHTEEDLKIAIEYRNAQV
ncbi:DUF262 domain-containing protein [Bernardetia sp.]|uniref:DUF262 domain-containing protein n=1 Tax=Bernardetia sp. TaxID=1937974 RepID=UPI0025BF4CB5|nr:DUF262 domain-containing protein [Bernardetia sp.]